MPLTLQRMLAAIATVAPNVYLQALVIAVLFVVLAKIADMVMGRVLRRLLQQTRFTLDDQILAICHRPIFVSIVLFGLGMAAGRLTLPPAVDFVTLAGLKTVAVCLWTLAAARLLRLLLALVSRDTSRLTLVQERTLPLFTNLLMILVTVVGIYFVFLAWRIDVSAWMASAGILGLAVSFAAKDTLANLFSGVFIVADAPYKLGDFIVLDSGERGQVTQIGIRSTRLLTRDDVEITVPNAVMGNAKITNEAGGPHEKYRIRVRVGVAYGVDIDRVHAVLLDVARQQAEVCCEPAPRVRFRAFGDSSLDHELLCWVEKPVLRGRVSHALNTAVYKRFLAEGIEIPFPQRDVHIRSTAGAAACDGG
jgi:MscS family membrane protein